MKIAIAQLNPTVGDIDGNLAKIEAALGFLQSDVDLIVFPELFLTGYPPRDLLEKSWFIDRVKGALRRVGGMSRRLPGTGILLGAPIPSGKKKGKGLYNAAVLFEKGKILLRQPKTLLPTYDVFDEVRYFDPAPDQTPVAFKDEKIGVSICEDAWNDPGFWPRRYYATDPIQALARKGATLLINISASPFSAGKEMLRFNLLGRQARKYRLPFIYVNQVGGNDELIFDGRSLVFDGRGRPAAVLAAFEEELRTIESRDEGNEGSFTPLGNSESVSRALILGLRDYMRKCGFGSALVGLSGGIDSAVTAALAARAIGNDNLFGIAMPSPYTSPESNLLAADLAENLGISLTTVPISPIYQSYLRSLKKILPAGNENADLASENIQARIRGNILMAFSNRFGSLVLSTGNKSEMATGYCTLYGDMSGGLAVLSDVPKTMVYELAAYINRESKIIPRGIIDRPPSAELKPDQTDQDTLPPYPLLDRILFRYIEEGRAPADIVGLGFEEKVVDWVVKAVNNNEYKRRQAPPGLKVTSKAFGCGRRMPIAATY